MSPNLLLAIAAVTSAVSATTLGFNYGSQGMNQDSFTQRFQLAQTLDNAPGFNAARLYTMIEDGTVNTPISAIPAALATNTRLLLGIWTSAGQATVTNELDALKSALQQYGSAFVDLIDGISVGSEDLYRISEIGIENHSDPGADPDTLVHYIAQVRATLAGTGAAGAPIGHVDTWTAWVNGSNQNVIDACDWIGMDGYPYWQLLDDNDILNAKLLFFKSFDDTVAAAGSKPVWITETGWAVSGPTEGKAEANIPNAKRYWDEVGCELFGKANVWWYTLEDAGAIPSFAVVGSNLQNPPLFDLSCSSGSAEKSVQSSSPLPVSSVPSATTPPFTMTNASATIATAPLPIPSMGLVNATTGNSSGLVTMVPATAFVYTISSVTRPVIFSAFTSNGRVTSSPVTTETYTILATQTYVASKNTTLKTSIKPTSAQISGACPTTLTTHYEFPHLIVAVDSSQPDTALGNSFDGKISSTVSTVFNFEIPPADVDKTCTLLFFLPFRDGFLGFDPNFKISGTGDIKVQRVPFATADSTFNSISTGEDVGRIGSISFASLGSTYTVSSGSCAELAGKQLGYLLSATGDLDLTWFEDSGHETMPAIGLFMNVC